MLPTWDALCSQGETKSLMRHSLLEETRAAEHGEKESYKMYGKGGKKKKLKRQMNALFMALAGQQQLQQGESSSS